MDLRKTTIWQLREKLEKKQVSCAEVVSSLQKRINEEDPGLHAYLSLNPSCLDEARQADARIARNEPLRPLEGIPVAVKDNLCTRGQATTCASRILAGFVPPYDATVIRRLRDAGAIVMGKTNLDEFAFGSSTENSAFGATRNPCAPARVPGGSSGGSAAAVGAGLCAGALGSDTGGSIRQPAAFCGIVGFKPTYGRVSRYGLVAFASSLDQIGPMTRDVRDACLLMNVIAGHDPSDSTSVNEPVPDYAAFLRPDLKGLTVGVPREYFVSGIQPEVERKVREAAGVAERLGARLTEVSLPHTGYGIAVYYVIATAEASANLARFDGVKYGYRTGEAADMTELYTRTRGEGFGDEAKRRIILGTYVLSSGYYDAYYVKAQKVRTLIKRDFLEAFRQVDLLLTPTTPELPFPAGEKKDDPLKMYLSDIFTVNVNLAGLPSISIPAGFSGEGLPVGVQLIGPHFEEARVLGAAYALEQHLEKGA